MKKIAIFVFAVNTLIYGAQFTNHVILKGETLSTIATKYETSVEELVKLNGIENSNLIYSGDKLKVYNLDYYDDIYIVKKGDTLSQIAEKFNMKVNELVEINNIKNKDIIYPKMKLKVYSDLVKLAKKYESIADNIWDSKDLVLKYRLSKCLNTYEIVEQLYTRSEIEYKSNVENKIIMLNSLKEALRLENIANIYYLKDNKAKAIENYQEALKKFEVYRKLNKSPEESLETKINRINLVLREVRKDEKNI